MHDDVLFALKWLVGTRAIYTCTNSTICTIIIQYCIIKVSNGIVLLYCIIFYTKLTLIKCASKQFFAISFARCDATQIGALYATVLIGQSRFAIFGTKNVSVDSTWFLSTRASKSVEIWKSGNLEIWKRVMGVNK